MAEPLDPAAAPPSPWRNGAGRTRELARRDGPDGEALWRISVADLERECEFSQFPAMDRVFVALGPVRLWVAGRRHLLADGDQLRFAGEDPVRLELDAPTRGLNVMTCRGCWNASVEWRAGGDGEAISVRLGERIACVRLEQQERNDR